MSTTRQSARNEPERPSTPSMRYSHFPHKRLRATAQSNPPHSVMPPTTKRAQALRQGESARTNSQAATYESGHGREANSTRATLAELHKRIDVGARPNPTAQSGRIAKRTRAPAGETGAHQSDLDPVALTGVGGKQDRKGCRRRPGRPAHGRQSLEGHRLLKLARGVGPNELTLPAEVIHRPDLPLLGIGKPTNPAC